MFRTGVKANERIKYTNIEFKDRYVTGFKFNVINGYKRWTSYEGR